MVEAEAVHSGNKTSRNWRIYYSLFYHLPPNIFPASVFFLLLFFSFLPYLLSAIYSFSLSSILFYLLCKERKSWVTLEEFNGIFKLFKSQIPLQILFSLYQEKYRFTHNFINNSRKITVPLKSIH